MKPFGWSTSLVVVLCLGAVLAAPGARVKRQELELTAEVENPVGSEDASLSNDLDRDKRKIPSDPKFEAKNAILGFVFGVSVVIPLEIATYQASNSSDCDLYVRHNEINPRRRSCAVVKSIETLPFGQFCLAEHYKAFSASKQSSQAVKDAINPTRPTPKSPTDDAVEFNRQKVSLQVPDAVFGSSFSLVTNISTQFGNLIMNSARRAGEFLWVLQPLIGKNLTIEIPTTTTTTPRTTTSRTTTASTSTAAMTTTTTATTTAAAASTTETNEIK